MYELNHYNCMTKKKNLKFGTLDLNMQDNPYIAWFWISSPFSII